MKKKIRAEHLDQVGDDECRIVKRGIRFFVYWDDGMIQRRDCYTSFQSEPLLESTAYRYDSFDPWIES